MEREVHSKKESQPRDLMVDGSVIAVRDKHPAKATSPIDIRMGSSVTVVR